MVRSGGGVTAAAGASAGLSRCATALGSNFPLDIAAITGWVTKLRSHTVQPQIPIEVAELVHVDDHAKYNTSPFVHAICATQWLSLLGTCRDAQVQRSFLLKICDNAWLFHCVQGRDKSKPFNWVIPAMTTAGLQGALNMMKVVRATPPEGEDPWLIPQFGPNTMAEQKYVRRTNVEGQTEPPEGIPHEREVHDVFLFLRFQARWV